MKPDSADAPKPDHQRPERPDFWDHRFRQGVTPWDAGGVPQELQAFARRRAPEPPPRVLIPGCGSAHDAAFLDALGWPVVALDFSAAALEIARAHLGNWRGRLALGDFFAHEADEPYDLIYERAFLCALPRKLWPGYGERAARLLAPDGILAGFFFFDDQPKGPPFGIDRAQLDALLDPFFVFVEERAVEDSLPVFAGKERWMVWQRRSTTPGAKRCSSAAAAPSPTGRCR